MVYGPYKRQGSIKHIKSARQNKQQKFRNYNARPGKQIIRLRVAFAICGLAFLSAICRLVYLYHTAGHVPDFADWRVVGTLAAAGAWLFFLLREAIKRDRS